MGLFLHGLAKGAPPAMAPPHDQMAVEDLVVLTSPAPTSDSAEALAELALRHNAILTAWAHRGPVLPLRFGTVFSGGEALQAHLSQSLTSLKSALEALGDAQEYVLRLRVVGQAAPSAAATPDVTERSGRAFLARGKAARDLRRDLSERRLALAQHLLTEARAVARQVTPAAAARPDRLLDAALLISPAQAETLTKLAQSHRNMAVELGLDLALTGPWPAYGFTMEGADVG